MKTCPECAEQIQDEAKRCRYCGTDLRPTAPLVKGIVFTHIGERYLLGVAFSEKGKPRYYGIWDTLQSGPATFRFERGDQHWSLDVSVERPVRVHQSTLPTETRVET